MNPRNVENVPLETPARIVSELTSRGYNADREAVTLLAGADDPDAAVEEAIERAPEEALKLSADHVERVLEEFTRNRDANGSRNTSTSTGRETGNDTTKASGSPGETKGVKKDGTAGAQSDSEESGSPGESVTEVSRPDESVRDPNLDARSLDISGDITGQSTGTGEYEDFVSVFRDRFKRLSRQLRGRVNARPTSAV